jgi:hypothetical protein
MVRSAILDPDQLVDGLVDDIDDLRELADEFGTRPFRLYTVTRSWDEGVIGEGEMSDSLEELRPPPKVDPFLDLGYRLQPCGIDEAGVVRLTEVSLANTYQDLVGHAPDQDLEPGVERLFLLRENYGQAQPDRLFVLDRSPGPDREKTIGWVLWLRKVRG